MTLHKPVLLEETINQLNLKKGDIVVDATLGGGGHGREILKLIGKNGVLIGIDADINAINNFLAQFPISNFPASPAGGQFPNNFRIPIYRSQNLVLINSNFVNLGKILEILKIKRVNGIIADLGWSSDQVENPEYGMSFQKEAELDMRYDRSQKLTAKKIVNEYSEKNLEIIISKYGEERFYKNIAKRIIEYRKRHTIISTIQLADIVKNAIPPNHRYGKINPATRTFQALRIEVNQELDNLKKFIPQAIDTLNSRGRLAIITFQSLEDRIVKNIFRENAGGCIYPTASRDFALRTSPTAEEFIYGRKAGTDKVKIITKKPIIPKDSEIRNNPRSRSAKLRVVEKI